jgi:hypothetical protein
VASATHTATAPQTTDQRALALRQHDIGQAEEDRRGVDRQARQRALGDEGRIVIEREKHVGGPAEIGSVATSAPITGPERSVITDADTTNAAVTAMRSASVRMKASSGDILKSSSAKADDP